MYKSHLICPDCIIYEYGLPFEKDPAETVLNRLAMFKKLNRALEHTFDSNDFPKIAFDYWVRTNDICNRCGQTLKKGVTKRAIELAEMGL